MCSSDLMGAITDTVDCFRCRFVLRAASADLDDASLLDLLRRIAAKHRWVHVEKLNEFDGTPGFTKAQGED